MKNLSKWILIVILSVAMIALILPVSAFAIVGGTENNPWIVTTWSTLREKMQIGGYINLGGNDLTISDPSKTDSSYLLVPENITVHLDLCGHSIDRGLDSSIENGYVILVNGTLIISDSEGTGVITGGYNAAGGGINVAGTLEMNGGSIASNCAQAGGGVYVGPGASFTMTAGEITSNHTTGTGNVYVDEGGTFSMSGGSITSGFAIRGGGVYLNGATFTMTGGEISGNSVEEHGGGIYASAYSDITIENALVNDNTADCGGGIYMTGRNSTLTLNSGAKITKNYALGYNGLGGGIYKTVTSSILTINEGALIGENEAQAGGGIYLKNTGTDTPTNFIVGGAISGNTATSGGGIYLFGGYVQMSGGSIDRNTAESMGGGVYIVNSPNGFFEMSGGSITLNSAQRGGGVSTGYTFTMTGGSIDHNTAEFMGGGVYMDSGAKAELSVSGSIEIRNNVTGGEVSGDVLTGGDPDNVFIYTNGKKITITGVLTCETPIGVNTNHPGQFTSGLTDHAEISDFSCEIPGYGIALNGSDEAEFRAIRQITFSSNGGSDEMAPEHCLSGSSYTLPACDFTGPDGRPFKCWSVGGVYYDAGDIITVTGDTSVTAEWKSAVLLSAISEDDAATPNPVGNVTISNPGIIYEGDEVTLTAQYVPGYAFDGWYCEDVRVATTLAYTLNVDADTELFAKFISRGSAAVSVGTEGGAEFRLNGAGEALTSYNEEVRLGTTVTFTAVDPDSVLHWENASGKILGTGASLTLTVTGNMTVRLVYKAAGSHSYVQFVSDYGQVLGLELVSGGDDPTFPTYPSKFGYTFVKWVFENTETTATADAVKAKIGVEKLITVKPLYTKDDTAYTVTVGYDGVVRASDVYSDISVGTGYTVIAPDIEGFKFMCWKLGETILGYNPSYFMLVSGDAELTACYVTNETPVEASPVITIGSLWTTYAEGVMKVSATVTRNIPDGYTVVEQGVLYAKDFALPENNVVYDGDGVDKFVGNSTSSSGTVTLHVKVDSASTVVTFRGYMILRNDSTGNESVFYTSPSSGSYSGLQTP